MKLCIFNILPKSRFTLSPTVSHASCTVAGFSPSVHGEIANAVQRLDANRYGIRHSALLTDY